VSEDKVCTKNPCWSIGTIYDPRKLTGVNITEPGVDGVLQTSCECAIVSLPLPHYMS
jgi:hypothetical protein